MEIKSWDLELIRQVWAMLSTTLLILIEILMWIYKYLKLFLSFWIPELNLRIYFKSNDLFLNLMIKFWVQK